MTGDPKPFKQYVFPPLFDSEGQPIDKLDVRNQRAYAMALGFSLDNPGVSLYKVAKHLRETVWPEADQRTAEAAVRRWRKFKHWHTYAKAKTA
jgi:hypothetical protein